MSWQILPRTFAKLLVSFCLSSFVSHCLSFKVDAFLSSATRAFCGNTTRTIHAAPGLPAELSETLIWYLKQRSAARNPNFLQRVKFLTDNTDIVCQTTSSAFDFAAMEAGATLVMPPSPTDHPSQGDMVVQRLLARGVPMNLLDTKQMGLVQFVKENKGMLENVVAVLLPGVEEAQLPGPGEAKGAWREYKQGYREGIRWAQWLMFEGDPEENLKGIQQETGQVRGVCGAVWGCNDIAYRCRTCENDPTCAICVPCFEAGNHVNHDYSMIHTGGGCCDCGDITAWKEAGFCSHHSGPGQAPSLSQALVSTFEPVMEALLIEWARRLRAAAVVAGKLAKKWSDQAVEERVATQTSLALVEMLLSFCNCSESLLTFTGGLMASDKVGLLDLLLKSECFLPMKVLSKLHELLFKLMGDPEFKYQFAKIFIRHYPHFIRDGLIEEFESTNGSHPRENPTLSSFSVQIFTVPTLTPQLVFDLRLLDMLLEALKDVFRSCTGNDGQLSVSKGPLATNFYYRIVDDVRFVLRHPEVAQYVARERLDLFKAWLHLLAYTQGMDSQRRQTSIHVEEETENWLTAYVLEVQMASIHSLFIDGAANTDCVLSMDEKSAHHWTDISCREDLEDEDAVHGHAKIGRISKESDVSGKVGTSGGLVHMDVDCRGGACGMVGQGNSHVSTCSKFVTVPQRTSSVPAALLWLISECAKVLDIWLLLDAYRTAKSKWPSSQKGGGVMQRRGLLLRGRGGRGIIRDVHGHVLDAAAGEVLDTEVSSTHGVLDTEVSSTHGATFRERLRSNRRTEPVDRSEAGLLLQYVDAHEVAGNSSHETVQESRDADDGSADWWMGSDLPDSGASLGFIWSDKEWSEIDFDVSQQEVSFHIPLHRFLAVALQKSLETCLDLDYKEGNKKIWQYDNHFVGDKGVLLKLFPACYQVPSFASFLMEHPLRIQVLCAQFRAGMWRRNGHTVQALCECYHSVRWCEDSSDLDLFLLQCCGVIAPPENFVERIVSRFGLADYFSLFLLRPNEYETTLTQHMLSLLIRIVVERGFCGYSAAQSCRRELIRRLSVSDATHSQLMKSLPPRLHENKQWQEALLFISTYYKPSGMQQGRFSLREECWKELDLYHPRWNARDLQSAEDRYLRACKASAVIKQLPQWQKPFSPFESLSRIATCGRVHDILRSVFFHAVFSEKISESRAPEGVLITALHLLSLGLDVCSLFAYNKGRDYKSTSLQSDSGVEFTVSSSIRDAQEPPPLLGKATERVYFGGADGTGISNRQSLLSLLVLLMQRYSHGEAHGGAGESHQCSIGALIKSLLEKFADLHRGCMYEIESFAPEILHRMSTAEDCKASDSAGNEQKPGLSEAEKRKLLVRERQAAVMAKMRAAQDKFSASFQSSQESSDMDKCRPQSKNPEGKKVKAARSQNEHCLSCALCRDSNSESPMSFLTFVQRSRLLAIAEKGIPSWERGHRRESPEALPFNRGAESGSVALDSGVHESQIHVELLNLIQMALSGEIDQERPIEVDSLLEILGNEGHAASIHSIQSSVDARMSETSSSDTSSDDLVEEEHINRSSDSANALLGYLGQVNEDEEARDEDGNDKTRQSVMVTVLLEYVSILSRNQKQQQQLETENSAALPGPQIQRYSRSYPANVMEGLLLDNVGSDDSIGVHMSSCGHAVHQDCLDRYLSSLLQRYHSRTLFEGLQIVDPDQGEFLCPVCRRLANSVLPYFAENSVPRAAQKGLATAVTSGPPSAVCVSSGALVWQVSQAMHLLRSAEELVWKLGFRKAVSKPLPKALKVIFDCLFSRLCGLYFPLRESNNKSNNCRISQSLLLWDVLRYTIMSAELAARTRKGALSCNTGNDLYSLWKEADSSKGSVLPLLLRAAKTIQNQNRQSLLLRARGMQLLVGSICFGVSKDSLAEPFMPGSVLKILQLIDNGREAADIQFWRRTADPVLAHDPFSSLVWLVFCLPLSFPSSMEPFISLVHLLYLVCVTQIVAFMGEFLLSNLSELQLPSSARSFLQAMVANLSSIPLFRRLDDQTSTAPAGPVLLAIRRFTLPYLRRCALLEKLLFDVSFEDIKSEKAKTYDAVTSKKAVDWISNESRQAISDAFEDLIELEELEQKFSLPSLQTILEKESNQEVVLRWCRHLSKESGSRKLLPLPRPITAAPFKLMDLPPLYQTLLQRYIKERCPVCSTVPEQPALCLLCGTLCCGLGRHPCCCSTNRQSECYKHAMACGGGVGVFLMIRKTNILLQRCARQASWPSPYLDAFGEEDTDMHRGKPLYLNEERYAALTAMVVSHGLDHSSLVLSHTTWETIIWG